MSLKEKTARLVELKEALRKAEWSERVKKLLERRPDLRKKLMAAAAKPKKV